MSTTVPSINIVAWGETLRLLVEWAGTLAFALSGVLAAARKQLDIAGVFVVAFLAAFGGGTVRDLLLDRRPFFWVGSVEVLWGVLILCIVAVFVLGHRHVPLTERAILWPDALGLGLFAITGVHYALSAGMPALVAVLLGVTTGMFGGVLRDVVCNEVPASLHDRQPYSVSAFVGGWVYVGMWHTQTPGWLSLTICSLLVTGLRMVTLWRRWTLPGWRA